MSNASDRRIAELSRQLANEQNAHAKTRNQLQAEVHRWQRLCSPQIFDLMGTYPPLRRLLVVLAEAADAQDPSRGAPIEDTARTNFVNVGNHASTSQTEAAVLTHARARSSVRTIGRELDLLVERITKDLERTTHTVGTLVTGSDGAYEMPDAPVCHRKGCPARGRQQSYRSWSNGCEGCGRMFRVVRE